MPIVCYSGVWGSIMPVRDKQKRRKDRYCCWHRFVVFSVVVFFIFLFFPNFMLLHAASALFLWCLDGSALRRLSYLFMMFSSACLLAPFLSLGFLMYRRCRCVPRPGWLSATMLCVSASYKRQSEHSWYVLSECACMRLCICTFIRVCECVCPRLRAPPPRSPYPLWL